MSNCHFVAGRSLIDLVAPQLLVPQSLLPKPLPPRGLEVFRGAVQGTRLIAVTSAEIFKALGLVRGQTWQEAAIAPRFSALAHARLHPSGSERVRLSGRTGRVRGGPSRWSAAAITQSLLALVV